MLNYIVFCVLCFVAASNITPLMSCVDEKPPVAIVIFGSTGDLAARKLFPAIYNLALEGELNKKFAVIGIGRREMGNQEFQASVYDGLQKFSRMKPNDASWSDFKQHVYYHKADFNSDEGYASLGNVLRQFEQEAGVPCHYIFYLATDSVYFPVIINKLSTHHLIEEGDRSRYSRAIIEKPFGRDLESAIELRQYITQFLEEEQIYLMDHYLGKEGVKKMSKLRFEHAELESLFNHEFIENVQITVSETIGIGTRANFYENTGHLRDVVQNHVMQLFALFAMELPADFNAALIHQEKTRVLDAIHPFPAESIDEWIIRGQYGPGLVQNELVPGYTQEEGVPALSQVETFVQAKLLVGNERWKGVPIYIRSGKRLAEQTTQITLNLKENPLGADAVTFVIQPISGAYLTYGTEQRQVDINMDASLARREAYENLILASISGDRSDFVDMGEVISTWRLFTPVLQKWEKNPMQPSSIYESGLWGPEAAEAQLLEDGLKNWKIINTPDY